MASRENQTLQISLISFAILVVLLAVTTYWFYSNSQKEYARAEQLQTDSDTAKNNSRTLIEENRNLKIKMGFSPDDALTAIDEAFAADMQNFGATEAEADRSYHNVLASTHGEKQAISQREATALKQLKQLKEDMLALESQKNAQIKTHEEEAKKANQDLAAEHKVFNAEREKFKAEIEKLTSEAGTVQEDSATKVAEANTKAAAAEKLQASTLRQLKQARATIAETLPEATFDSPDGSITWVSQRKKRVWIDLGSSDGLRPQTSFSIFTQGQVIGNDVAPKAKIEVTRILESHLSEARIVTDELANPILPNDPIFSTAWRRGSRVHFALTGILDLDGDKKSDVDQLLDIIRINDGVIDEYVSAKGKRVKKGDGMTIDTKYLVVGITPTPTGDDKAIHGSTIAMLNEADASGVRRISLQSFLDMMGWASGERTVQLGRGARARDFPARLGGGAQKLDPGGARLPGDDFRKRHPQPAY